MNHVGLFNIRTPELNEDFFKNTTPEQIIPTPITLENTSREEIPIYKIEETQETQPKEAFIEENPSVNSRSLGAIIIFVVVAILIIAETIAEPSKSLYSSQIRYWLLAGELLALLIVIFSTYYCCSISRPGLEEVRRTSTKSLYLLTIFVIVLLLLSISHRIGYGLAVFTSVLMVILTFGIAGVTRAWLMVVPIILSLIWLGYLILNPPPGETF